VNLPGKLWNTGNKIEEIKRKSKLEAVSAGEIPRQTLILREFAFI